MWSRVVEVMLGVWLVISPFVFAHPALKAELWINDMVTGTAVILFGLFSYWMPTRLAHVLTLLVACWLIGFAYYQGLGSPFPAAENNLILGLMLLMFALIPNQASQPPQSWQDKRTTI